MMKQSLQRIAVVAIALSLAICAAFAQQQTRSQLNNYNNTYITTNGNGAITGAIANGLNADFINSFGVLSDTNSWTGANSFLSNPTFRGCSGVITSTGTGPFNCGPVANSQLAAGAAAENLGVALVTDPAYGAVCNGSTNDETAIQAAFSSGKNVIFPSTVSCLAGNLTFNATNGQTVTMTGSSLVIPPGSNWGIKVTGFKPGLQNIYVTEAATNGQTNGATVSQTTLTAGLNTSVAAAYVVAGGSGGSSGTCTLTGTTGTGTKFIGTIVLSGASLTPGASVTVSTAGSYSANPTSTQSEPVTQTGCGSLASVTLAFNMTGPTTVSVASAAAGPGIQVGQRYQIQKENGSYSRGFVTSVSGTTIGISDPPGSPVASGAPFWSTFGAIYVLNAYQPNLTNVSCNGSWGCLLMDDPTAAGGFGGVSQGQENNIWANGSRMFGIIKGRNIQTQTFRGLNLWGGWTESDTGIGDGSTTVFSLKYFLNLKREITGGFLSGGALVGNGVTVNGVLKTQGTDYTVNSNGLGITFISAPANGATVLMQYFTYGGVGFEDNCEALVTVCGGNMMATANILQWSDDLYFDQGEGYVYNHVIVDGAAFNCVTFDATGIGGEITDLQAYWCANQIKAKNNALGGSVLIGYSSPQPSTVPASGVIGQLSSIDVGSAVDWPGGLKTAVGNVYENKNGFQSNFASAGLACWGCPPSIAPIEPFEWYNPLGILYFNGQNTIGFTAIDAYIGTTASSGQMEIQALGTGGSAHLNGKATAQLLVNSSVEFSCSSTSCSSTPPIQSGSYVSTGSAPVLSSGSCTGTSWTGGSTAGTFAAPLCAAGTIVLSGLPTAPNGYTCVAQDQTTPADTLKQTANSATSCTLTGTTASADVIAIAAMAW